MIPVLALLALGLLLALLTIGQALAGVQCDFLWFHAEYLRSLGSEVGGSGIDAIAVGTLAGAIVSAIERRRRLDAHRRAIERRRRPGAQASLEEDTAEWSRDIDLSGFRFTGETISERRLSGIRFAGGATPQGAFVNMTFDDSALRSCSFGHGFVVEDTRFVESAISRCDFGGSVFRGARPSALVAGGSLLRTRFDGATFDNVEIDPATMRGCTFWGASFRDSKLPTRLREALSRLDAVVQGRPGEWSVITRRQFYGRPSPARLWFALQTLLGAAQVDPQGDAKSAS